MRRRAVAWREFLAVWGRVAALSFGGPAGQIAVMHRILVEEKRWIGERRFLHALNYCMLLPGPEAMQLATYVGWLLNGTRGGILAGGLFVLPGFAAILGLSVLYALFRRLPAADGLFLGLRAAVLAVVVEALLRLGRRALGHRVRWALAAGAFAALAFFEVPFPAVVVAAGGIGFLGACLRVPGLLEPAPAEADASDAETPLADRAAAALPTAGRSVAVAAGWLTLWLLPVAAVHWTLGTEHVLARQAAFFSRAAVVTFGGAYAVLAYLAQAAVETYGWLAPGEMLDGLSLAETTPGPLIQVVQFVGFLAAFHDPRPFSPLIAGLLGSLVTTWVTYAPCFLWIFLGAPYVESLRSRRALSSALAAITAAVVGVILNVAVFFALHVLFANVGEVRVGPVTLPAPSWSEIDLAALAIAAGAVIALFRLRWGMARVLAAAALAGLLAGGLGMR